MKTVSLRMKGCPVGTLSFPNLREVRPDGSTRISFDVVERDSPECLYDFCPGFILVDKSILRIRSDVSRGLARGEVDGCEWFLSS